MRSVVANCCKCAPNISKRTSTLLSTLSDQLSAVAVLLVPLLFSCVSGKAGKVKTLMKRVAVREWAVSITCLFCTLLTRLDDQSAVHSVPSQCSHYRHLRRLFAPLFARSLAVNALDGAAQFPYFSPSTHASLLHFLYFNQAWICFLSDNKYFLCLLVLVLLLIIVHLTSNQ